MKKYKIIVKEILERAVEIKAKNIEDALWKIEDKYYKEKIVLDWSDFKNVEFKKFILPSIIFKITEEEILGHFQELKKFNKIDKNKKLSRKRIKKILDYIECDEMLAKDIRNSIKDSILEVVE